MKPFVIALAIILFCLFMVFTEEFFLSTALTLIVIVCLGGLRTVWRYMRYGCYDKA